MNERLYRTVEDRMLLGVLGGISLRLGIDPSVVRVLYAIVTVVSGIFPLLIAYVIMAAVIPDGPPGWEASVRAGGRDGNAGSDARGAAGWDTGAAGAAGWGTDTPAAAGTPGPAAWDAGAAPAAGPGSTAAGAATGAAADGGAAWGAGWGAPASVGRTTTGGRRGGDPRAGAIVGGLVLLGLGSLFLFVQLVPDLDWGVAGPVALVVLGAILVVGSIRPA